MATGLATACVTSARGATDPDPTAGPRLEVGITPTASALEPNGAEPIVLACRALERAIDACLPAGVEYCVGPHGIVDPPESSISTVRSTAEWWRSNRPREYADAEVLVCSSAVDWDYGGMAPRIGGPIAVAGYGDRMGDERYRRILLREVGHCLGLGHEHGRRWSEDDGTVGTPMVPAYPDRATLRFSTDAARRLRGYAGVAGRLDGESGVDDG